MTLFPKTLTMSGDKDLFLSVCCSFVDDFWCFCQTLVRFLGLQNLGRAPPLNPSLRSLWHRLLGIVVILVEQMGVELWGLTFPTVWMLNYVGLIRIFTFLWHVFLWLGWLWEVVCRCPFGYKGTPQLTEQGSFQALNQFKMGGAHRSVHVQVSGPENWQRPLFVPRRPPNNYRNIMKNRMQNMIQMGTTTAFWSCSWTWCWERPVAWPTFHLYCNHLSYAESSSRLTISR